MILIIRQLAQQKIIFMDVESHLKRLEYMRIASYELVEYITMMYLIYMKMLIILCYQMINLSVFGWIIWRNFLLIFGGWSCSERQYKDEIWWIDLSKIDNNAPRTRWCMLKRFKCPLQSHYEAGVLENGIIHLFSTQNHLKIGKHYQISIKLLLGECLILKAEVRSLRKLLIEKENINQKLMDTLLLMHHIDTFNNGFKSLCIYLMFKE